MNPLPALKYQVTEQIFDSKSCLDEENFYHQKQGTPSELTRQVTHMLGDYSQNYPLTTMTLGSIGYGGGEAVNRAIEIDDVQFTYPVMGRTRRANVISKTIYVSTDQPGIGNSEFKLYFPDNWIKRFFIIQSHGGVQAYVLKDLELVDGHYEATCKLDPATASEFVDFTQVKEGAAWVPMFTAVPESLSRSTESNMVMPGSFKNQMGFMRAGASWAGNAANKVMKITMSYKGKSTNVWMDYFMWQFENDWLSQNEHLYWYSKYNRLANGTIPLTDLTSGKVIPRGSGVYEQIQNRSSYARLGFGFLNGLVGDARYGKQDQAGKQITLYTGRGGMREFDRAIREEGLKVVGSFANIGDKFITGSGAGLMLGGYFNGYVSIDGDPVKIKYNPVNDYGQVALAQQAAGVVHPETGWPLESYRMTFIDDSDYDGQPNVRYVAQKGRAYLHGIVPGLAPAPRSIDIMNKSAAAGDGTAVTLSTDVDQSSYTRFASAGIQIMNASNCFDLICTAGQ